MVARRRLQAQARHASPRRREELPGLLDDAAGASPEEVAEIFDERIRPRVVELDSGRYAPEIDAVGFDQRSAASDPETSRPAPPNRAGIPRLPEHAWTWGPAGINGGLTMATGSLGWSVAYAFLIAAFLVVPMVELIALTFLADQRRHGIGFGKLLVWAVGMNVLAYGVFVVPVLWLLL